MPSSDYSTRMKSVTETVETPEAIVHQTKWNTFEILANYQSKLLALARFRCVCSTYFSQVYAVLRLPTLLTSGHSNGEAHSPVINLVLLFYNLARFGEQSLINIHSDWSSSQLCIVMAPIVIRP